MMRSLELAGTGIFFLILCNF